MASRLLPVNIFVAVLLQGGRQAYLASLTCMQAFCLGQTSTLPPRDQHLMHGALLLTMAVMQHTCKLKPV